MRLYIRECRRIATSIIYYLFIAMLVLNWYQNFFGITTDEINSANGSASSNLTFDRPLLVQPSEDDEFFGSKTEENPENLMIGATKTLLYEYEENTYATYPFGYYKAITLSESKQVRVLEILCEITGLTEQQLMNLPQDYFPAVTGTMITFDSNDSYDGASISISGDANKETENNFDDWDITQKFQPQITYEQFKERMQEIETIIGEKGSQYSMDMMITYFGISDMSYEEAVDEYTQTIKSDEITGGFARLFCDYIGLVLGLYPIFLVVIMCMKDRSNNMTELIYSRKVSSVKLVLTRYFATITMVLIPVFLLSLESLIPLLSFGTTHGLSVDNFAYIKYILWWLLPTVLIVTAIGMFFTLLTDTPVAILLQFLWWLVDKGITGLSGDTGLFTLMVRHNTLRGYEIIHETFGTICLNRLLMTGISILFITLSVWILKQKRKGKINAANVYDMYFNYFKNKFQFGGAK